MPYLVVTQSGDVLYFENGNLETPIWEMDKLPIDNSKIDNWKIKNIQHGLVWRRRLASGQVQHSLL